MSPHPRAIIFHLHPKKYPNGVHINLSNSGYSEEGQYGEQLQPRAWITFSKTRGPQSMKGTLNRGQTWKGKRDTKVTLAKPSQPRLSLLLLVGILRLGKFSTIAFPSPEKQNGPRIFFFYIYTHNSTMIFAGLLAKVWV